MTREDVFKYVKDKYNTEPEYLWIRYPNTAILRCSGNKKWYGAVLAVAKSKVGLKGEGKVDLLNLKCGSELVYILQQEEGFLPGYHMNKEHWLSIVLGGPLPAEKVFGLLDISYDITKKMPGKIK